MLSAWSLVKTLSVNPSIIWYNFRSSFGFLEGAELALTIEHYELNIISNKPLRYSKHAILAVFSPEKAVFPESCAIYFGSKYYRNPLLRIDRAIATDLSESHYRTKLSTLKKI